MAQDFACLEPRIRVLATVALCQTRSTTITGRPGAQHTVSDELPAVAKDHDHPRPEVASPVDHPHYIPVSQRWEHAAAPNRDLMCILACPPQFQHRIDHSV
jgi:hypothetical protein